MGQATVDLPDPLNASAAPDAGNADDLLAQLAGKEIDRLLAESQVDDDAPVEPEKVHTAADVSAAAPAATAPTSEPAVEPPPAMATFSPPVGKLDAELEQLLEPVMDPPVAEIDGAIASEAQQRLAPLTGDAAVEAPTAGEGSAAPEPLTPAAIAAVLDEHLTDPPLPLLLRPLEWMNAPLTRLPNSVREAIGKIAIVTLLNAIAVWVYVTWVR
jgi:hypothetical protein